MRTSPSPSAARIIWGSATPPSPLNFSGSSALILAQYYNSIRFGRQGYVSIADLRKLARGETVRRPTHSGHGY